MQDMADVLNGWGEWRGWRGVVGCGTACMGCNPSALRIHGGLQVVQRQEKTPPMAKKKLDMLDLAMHSR